MHYILVIPKAEDEPNGNVFIIFFFFNHLNNFI